MTNIHYHHDPRRAAARRPLTKPTHDRRSPEARRQAAIAYAAALEVLG